MEEFCSMASPGKQHSLLACSLILKSMLWNYTIPFVNDKKKIKSRRKKRIEHLPELSVLMSIVHDKPTEERKSNALRSTNLRDSDQHWNSPNMPAVFFINKKFTCCAERAFLSLPIICLWPNSNKRFNTHHTMRTTTTIVTE